MSDGTLTLIISLTATGLFILGVPIFLIIGLWVVAMSFVVDITLSNVGFAFSAVFTTSFALLAMPLFILTGDLINRSGIAHRMSAFAYSCLGWLRGGLGMASIGACGMFAAISGSNSATTATIGGMMHPRMVKNGYDPRFSAATVGAGGTVGIIIPPSIIFIVYGFLMNLSITDLFLAGILPGVLMVLAMQVTCWIVCRANGWGHLIRYEINRMIRTAFGAWLGFFAIGLVLWGIYTGKFSPTEAAGVTVGFVIVVALLSRPLYMLINRGRPESEDLTRTPGWTEMVLVVGFRLRDLPEVVLNSARIAGMLAPLIGISVVMQQILSLMGAKAAIETFLTGLGGYYAVLLMAMLFVFLAGMVLESLPNTIIMAPILAPIAASVGVDPIHFAVVFLIGGSIGFITPPYGLNLYVASGVTGVPYMRLLKYIVPYLIALIMVWLVVAFAPWLSLALI
ncbi:MAG: TRAP transporter large permease [Pararhodobacter sp.]|nr:TRAP transporter large permease [Pararhodobacter sp.]